jgi:hypothetical protein
MKPPIQFVVGAVALTLRGPSWASLVGAHEIEPALIAMTLGEASLADMLDFGSCQRIQGMDVAPAASFGLEVFDGVTNTADPIPAERFDRSEPRPRNPASVRRMGRTPIGITRCKFSRKSQ